MVTFIVFPPLNVKISVEPGIVLEGVQFDAVDQSVDSEPFHVYEIMALVPLTLTFLGEAPVLV